MTSDVLVMGGGATGQLVQRELNGSDTKEFTKDLDTVLVAFQRSVTRDATRLYECMGDAYQCHLRVHLAVVKLFHLGLPLVKNDYLWIRWE